MYQSNSTEVYRIVLAITFTFLAGAVLAQDHPLGILKSSAQRDVSFVQEAGCFNPQFTAFSNWSDEGSVHTSHLLHSGDVLRLWHEELWEDGWQTQWHLDRLTGPNLPDHTESEETIFTGEMYHYLGTNNPYFDKYLVSLYRIHEETGVRILVDWAHVFVLADVLGVEQGFAYGFEPEELPEEALPDDYGQVKATSYPMFSGSGNRRSDMHTISEKFKGACFYPAAFSAWDGEDASQAPREGAGYVKMANPRTSRVRGVENPAALVCEGENVYTYDFCEDACGVHVESLPYADYEYHSRSLCSEVSLDVFPFALEGDDSFVGFSFRVPEGFDESDLVDPETGAMGQQRFQAIAEFKQPHWPVPSDQLPNVCHPVFQLLYLGDGLIGLRYGVHGHNQLNMGPWPIEVGEWVDVALHVRWQSGQGGQAAYNDEEGLLKLWLNQGESGYIQQCMQPMTPDFLRATDPEMSADVLTTSENGTVVNGPNMLGVNPPFFSLLAKRGVVGSGICGYDFTSEIHFDELRVGTFLSDVLIGSNPILGIPSTCEGIASPPPPNPEDTHRSLQAESLTPSLSCWPNPSQGHVSVAWTEGWMPQTVKLVDLSGRTLREESLQRDGAHGLEWTLDEVPAGTYLILATDGHTSLTNTLVVL